MIFATDNVTLVTVHIMLQYLRNLSQIDVVYLRRCWLWFIFSGVVGRERMGTAFPHKKLSGNGVPIREILRNIFLLLLLN